EEAAPLGSFYRKSCQAPAAKIFVFRFSEKYDCLRASRSRPRGALRDRHERWERDAMDVSARRTSASDADGQAVWSRSPDAGIKFAEDDRQATVATKPGTPGRARSSR